MFHSLQQWKGPQKHHFSQLVEMYISTHPFTHILLLDCYNKDDLGIHYNGSVSTTESGRMCQAWDSNTPHFHPLTSVYRSYLEGHNYCRNPEGRGSRPWCYTTDPDKRWEYCNVPLCTDATSDDEENNAVIIVVVTIVSLLLLTGLALIVVFTLWTVMKRKHRQSSYNGEKLESNTDKRTPVHNHYIEYPSLAGSDGLPNILRENITYISDLGEGNFGMVVKGEVTNLIPGQFSTLVAIKVLKKGSSSDARSDFIREAVLVHQFDHPNILKLLGVCFDQEPFCIAFEFMDLGDLNKYLRNRALRVSQPTTG